MRLVALDTTRPGEDSGELDSDRLAWLEDELARSPTKPTVVAMHHPPFATGLPGFDRIDLPPSQRRALAEAVARHPQVLAFVAGHIHRATTGVVAGRPAITAPSTYLHSRALFDSDRLEFVAATPGFAIHALVDGGLASHIESAEPPR
jgi:3',5'-cyclic AMP phosphodiesterase CpdA